MKISSSFWRFPGSEWESATLSPNFHFFFICNFIFFHFPLFLMVFHCFSWLSWISGATGKENEKKWKKNEKMKKKWKKMKISSSFWRFPGSEWESATLSPNFHFFFICNFIFFHFPLFLMVFHCFSWLSWISGATGKENEKKWKKNEKMKKKWKKMKISSSFWRFPGSEWESATLSPNFHFFFICNFIFFHFPLFLMVFHCFSWFSWISGATGKENERKMKKNEKQMKKKGKNEKKWKFPRVFEDFLVRSENLQLWVQIFIFFSFATSFFFHLPLFLMVFHCFSLFFMVFLDFRCHGKGKWKKND